MRFKALQDMIVVSGSTLVVLGATKTTIELLIVNFKSLKCLIHKTRIMLSCLVNFKIPSCKGFKPTPLNAATEHLYFLIGFRVTRCNMGFQRELMKKCIAAVIANMRAITSMLLLQMIMQRRRISMRVSWSGLGSEVTEMTHQVPICIPLITNELLLLCYIINLRDGCRLRSSNHSGVLYSLEALIQFLRPLISLKVLLS